jgi:hypothetical protein
VLSVVFLVRPSVFAACDEKNGEGCDSTIKNEATNFGSSNVPGNPNDLISGPNRADLTSDGGDFKPPGPESGGIANGPLGRVGAKISQGVQRAKDQINQFGAQPPARLSDGPSNTGTQLVDIKLGKPALGGDVSSEGVSPVKSREDFPLSTFCSGENGLSAF